MMGLVALHVGAKSPDVSELLRTWDLDHTVIWLLPVVVILYGRGLVRVRKQLPQRYPIWRLVSFFGGITTVFLALASPLDAFGPVLLFLHMTQHMLLMMVAPPLIWLGQPMIPLLRAFPSRSAKRVFGPVLTSHALRRVARCVVHPMICWSALAVVMVVWHLPQLYEIGLTSEGWHEVQHAFFFSAALLFWWPVVGVWPSRPVWPQWMMIPYLIAADLVNTSLSAVLTFSGRGIYQTYEHIPRVIDLSALDDQALAGVIMWVPGSIAFLVPAIVLTVRLVEPARRPRSRAAAAMSRL